MTLLPWVWFAVGTLVGSGLLAVFAVVGLKVCRRAAGRVRLLRFTLLGLLGVPLVQLFGWVPRWEFGGGHQPAAVSEAPAIVGFIPDTAPQGVAGWPTAGWVGGVALGAGVFLVRRVALARAVRRLPTVDDAAVIERLTVVAARLGLARPPRAVFGRAGGIPFACGVFRPTLVLPADFARLLTPGQQEAVLAHECGHLVGRDPLWTAVGECVSAVVWWNPLVWWVRARHRAACEAAADEATFALADGPGLLAESLFVMAARMAGASPAAASAAAGRCRSTLARRVKTLLTVVPAAAPPRSLRPALVWVGWATVTSVAVTVGMSVIGTASGGPSLVAQWIDQKPEDMPTPFPRTLGDLHPELRTNPDDADLAGYRVAVVRPSGDNGSKPATEEEAFDHVGATAEQRARLAAVKAENWDATKQMYRSPKDQRVSMGLDINRRWRAELEAVLTPDQYRRYLEFWKSRPVVAVRMPD